MSHTPIRLKINCSKITKARLFKGEKGTYLNAVCIPLKQEDQYQNTHMVVEDVSKEEREKGIKGAIIGNARVMPPKDGGGASSETRQPRKW